MAGYYELKVGKSGKFSFNLKSGNHQIVLSSETYDSKAGALGGIASVQKNCGVDERFEARESKKNEPYFVLKAANGEIIGKSEMYTSTSGTEAIPRLWAQPRTPLSEMAGSRLGTQRSPN